MGSLERRFWCNLVSALIVFLICSTYAVASQNQQIGQKLAALENIQETFSFVVLGDNRSGDDIYKKIVSIAMQRNPAFVVNTGDMIEKPGDKEDWEKFWKMSDPITVPYFLTVGNHDAHPRVPFSENIYKDQVELPGNESYYSFTAGNSLFIVLDSFIDKQEKKIIAEQYKWLEGILAASPKKHRFVFLHHPLFTVQGKGRHSGDCLDKYPADRDRLQALFVKFKVDAVFAGHEHFYQRQTVDGITHIITGGGGASIYEKDEEGGFYHIVFVTVDGDKVTAEVIDIHGKVRDRF